MGKAGMKAAAGLILAVTLAACAPTFAIQPAVVTPTPAASTPIPAPTLAPEPPPRSPIPQPNAPPRDQCGASELQRLVGRPRTEAPVPINPNRQRVACTTCPVTEEFNPARLNIFFDAQTGRIKQVRCG